MRTVTVVGVDGRPLTELATRRLAAATLVVGARRHLDSVALPAGAEQHVLGDVAAGLEALRRHQGAAIVLAAGDPGFFGIVRLLRASGVEIDVVPAVSSVAAAFALAGLSWDDAVVVSAHGRELGRAVHACRAAAKVAVLTGPRSGPSEIGAALLDVPRRLIVAEDLGGSRQQVTECTPEQAAARSWAAPNVVLVLGTPGSAHTGAGWVWPGRQTPDRWALPEESFDHRDSMVTKAEVRALALAHLGPGLGDLLWDVGAGSGAVAVECARFGAAVIAIDRDGDQCERARRNASRYAVEVATVRGEAPTCLGSLPDPDAVFVGGGGPDVVSAAAARRPRTVVAALAAVDRLAGTRDALRTAGYDVGGAVLSASRLADLPDATTRLAATNPVFVVWGHR